MSKRKKRKKKSTTESRQVSAEVGPQKLSKRRYAVYGIVFTVAFALLAWLFVRRQPSSTSLELAPTPNVLLVSIDTLRADYVGTYGARVKTPHIDRLAAEGVVFEKALTPVPITLPAHASLLTGLYPIAHGVRDNGTYRLHDDYETLAETFRKAGYRTAAFVGAFSLDSRFGLDQGFEVYDDYYGDSGDLEDFSFSERPADEVLLPAMDWLRKQRAEPWFAFVHIWDPHAPYLPPQPFLDAHSEEPYVGEVAYVDDALGRFLEEMERDGFLSNTLVVFTADHGEGLGEHGESTHSMFAYESTLHVPLILNWEGVLPAELRVPARVGLIDVAPTILELAGLEAVEDYQGRSLVPFMTNPSVMEEQDIYFETLSFHLNKDWAPLTGVYSDDFKYIDVPIPELYNLADDPGETRNLYDSEPEISRQTSGALEQIVARHTTEEARGSQMAEVGRETVERLQALGYVIETDRARESRTYTAEDDPKRLVHLSDKIESGVEAYDEGRLEDAIRIFQEVIEARPRTAKAYDSLAMVLQKSGRLNEAIEVLDRALRQGAETRSLMARLGAYLQEAGRLERSVALLELAIEKYPDYVEAYNYLAVSYARMGRTEEALQSIDKVLSLDPSYASAFSNRGSIYLGAGNASAAEESFRAALDIDPRLAVAWNGLGAVYARTSRDEEAVSVWQKAIEIDSHQYDTLYNLGVRLMQMKRNDEALIYLERFLEIAPANRYRSDFPEVRKLVAELGAQ